jgi:hypothetical protein
MANGSLVPSCMTVESDHMVALGGDAPGIHAISKSGITSAVRAIAFFQVATLITGLSAA